MYILNQFFKKLIYYIIINIINTLMALKLEKELEVLKIREAKIKMEIQKRKEEENNKNIKINGLNELKKLIDKSDDYISNSGHKTKYRGVSEQRTMIFHTNPKFHLLYKIIKNQQQEINELKNIIKEQYNAFERTDGAVGELQAEFFHEYDD